MSGQDDHADHLTEEWVDDEEFEGWDIRAFVICMGLAAVIVVFLTTGFGIVDSIQGRVGGGAALLFLGARLMASFMRPLKDDFAPGD